jgi:hypothetical protein
LATADIRWVTFGKASPLIATASLFFEVVGPAASWAKAAGRSAPPQAPGGDRELLPVPTVCIQSYFAMGRGLHHNHDLVGGVKRREGGGWCKWAWLPPAKPVKPAKKEEDHTRDVGACEEARSVNLNGLPAELLSGRIPPHWVDGIARLESHKVPRDVPAHRWRQFINDCHIFLLAKENWAERAAGHGWNDLELFGCCRRPLERLGNAGLLWAINGGRLVELRRDWAVIERASDRSRHVHQRERPKAADITLPWSGLR